MKAPKRVSLPGESDEDAAVLRRRAPLPPPPQGAPWDLPLGEASLVFADLEMTGLDIDTDRIVEVCLVRVVGGRETGRIETLIHPGERAGGAAHVHGLDATALTGAPPFADVAMDILTLLDGAILVAHAAEWDVAFLEAELLRAGRPCRFKYWLDTLILSRRAFALPSHSLDALATALNLDRGRAHRAGDDVRVMQALFERTIPILAPTTARDLWQVRIAEHRARDTIVKACTDAVAAALPVIVTYRASRRAPEPLVMVLTDVRSDLDPPRVLGYQLPGRGRRELRTDRILRIEPSAPAASPA